MPDTLARYPSLDGRAVLVTGGASGIGAEMVRAFAAEGARTAFLDRDASASEALSAETGAVHALCDLTDIAATRAAIAQVRETTGSLRILVNSAARDDRHDWRDVTPEYWDERQATNLRHQFFVTQAVAPDMIEAGGGSIVNLGSNSWWEAVGNFPAYATAKAAVHGLTRTMARDLGPHRIRVNCVVPGWVMTQRQKDLWVTPEAIAKHRDRQCLPDLVQPEDVARMVLFLASDDARAISASNFFVDGGSV